MPPVRRPHGLALILVVFFAACGDPAGPGAGVPDAGTDRGTEPQLPWPLTEFPALPDVMLDVPEARIDLGETLFYDPVLSSDRETACATLQHGFPRELVWDGRAQSLEEQAITPLLAMDEMDRDPEEAVMEMTGMPGYVDLFAEAFPEDPRITVANLASALAAFQRTMISSRSLYDGYIDGDLGALSEEVIEGMFRFADMGCDSISTMARRAT